MRWGSTRQELEQPVNLWRSCTMPDEKIYDEPSEVTASDGNVVVDGPDGVDVAVTPEAAVETGERLIDKAAHAAGQRRFKELPHQPKDATVPKA